MLRIALLVSFLLSGYLAFGQSLDYKISASLHYPFIPSGLVVNEYPGTSKGTYLGVSTEYYDGSFTEEIISTTFKSKAGIKFGSIVSFPLNGRFSLETGLMVNLTRFEAFTRKTSTTYCEGGCVAATPEGDYAKDENDNVIVGPNGQLIPIIFYFPVVDYHYPAVDGEQSPPQQQESPTQEEPTSSNLSNNSTEIANSILYIDIPVTAKYTVWKNLKLEAGFLTSLLVYSDQDIKRIAAEEKVDGREFNKALFALRLAVSHPINRKLEVDAGYNRYLSGIYEYAPEEIDHKYHFFNLGISYKIMN